MASAKAESRDSFGSKRSRNEGMRFGDWTCPKCGNINFGFRTECNRSHCGAPRPSLSPRIGSVPLPGSFDRSAYYGGGGSIPSMPVGMSNGYRMPLTFPGMRYDYGLHANSQMPYGLLPGYGPPGPMGGINYGHGLGMDGLGYDYHGSPMPVPGSWHGEILLDNNGSRKRRGGPDGLSEGDWVCPKCDNVNFSFRTICNMKKCGAPRPTSQGSSHSTNGNKGSSSTPEGSWTCDKCGNLNYPFRTVCNRKGCGNERPSEDS